MLSNTSISTWGSNVKRKFQKRMDFFLVEGGSCSYDNEINEDNVIVNVWANMEILEL